MIKKAKDIYQTTAERHNIPVEVIASIGNVLFRHLRESLNEPSELAYEVPGLGVFCLRMKKFEHNFGMIKNAYENGNLKVVGDVNRKPEDYKRKNNLLEKCKQFRKEKAEHKVKRNAENETYQSSEDNTEEH